VDSLLIIILNIVEYRTAGTRLQTSNNSCLERRIHSRAERSRLEQRRRSLFVKRRGETDTDSGRRSNSTKIPHEAPAGHKLSHFERSGRIAHDAKVKASPRGNPDNIDDRKAKGRKPQANAAFA